MKPSVTYPFSFQYQSPKVLLHNNPSQYGRNNTECGIRSPALQDQLVGRAVPWWITRGLISLGSMTLSCERSITTFAENRCEKSFVKGCAHIRACYSAHPRCDLCDVVIFMVKCAFLPCEPQAVSTKEYFPRRSLFIATAESEPGTYFMNERRIKLFN